MKTSKFYKAGNVTKCEQIEKCKIRIRNKFNPKLSDNNKRIVPLDKGVSHNHIIHSTDIPSEFFTINRILYKYSTISEIIMNNGQKQLEYDFKSLKNKQNKFFENPAHEMNTRIENLKDVIEVFNKTSTNYWLQGKTLLGMYKDNKLLDDDHDEDIGTFCENIYNVCCEIIPELKSLGFEIIRATKNNSMVSVMRNFRYIDICFFTEQNSMIGYEKKQFPKNYYAKFMNVNINGFEYSIPEMAKEIIFYSYKIYI